MAVPTRLPTAVRLRERFRALPKEQRDANQSYSIRIWRSVSWLERAESMPASDYEGRFISAWIGFNALYGRLDDDGGAWGDREAMDTLLAHLWRIDADQRLRRVLNRDELQVLKIIDDKYLSMDFWKRGSAAERGVKKKTKEAMTRYRTTKMESVVRLLFERLYVMRNQVFHGASTKGSSLNRRAIQRSASILIQLLRAMIVIMIDHGIDEDWGGVWFPPYP